MRSLSSRRRAGRFDPAPSRWAYRIERLWLTPSVRRAVRLGVPALLIAGAIGSYFADAERRAAIVLGVAELRASIEARPEFAVKLMAIDGAGPEVSAEIREILPVSFPASSFDLDLEAMRDTVLGIDAVAEAAIRIRSGGVLHLKIKERVPAVIWKRRGGIDLLDATGAHVAALADRGGKAGLPVIAGQGANAQVPEALALIAAAAPLGERFLGLVRMGERRWDVVLDRDQRILLPENAPVRALERAIALSEAQDMLARDVASVDLRNPARPTLRLNGPALENYLRITTKTKGERAE